MNSNLADRLSLLRKDFASVAGSQFEHFYCPILFVDEPVELCQAHVVSRAFRGAARRWTVQRADVDAFFGGYFEGDFTILQERGQHSVLDILSDNALSRRLRPQILVDGEAIPHFRPKGAIPQQFTELEVSRPGRRSIPLALKLHPSDALARRTSTWEVSVKQDLRLAALPSLLRSAHLTLFDLVGYGFALTAGGWFLGNDVLGRFYRQNRGRGKHEVLERAKGHFPQFVNLVRPITKAPRTLRGTVSDRFLFLLYQSDGAHTPWAFLVFVRTGRHMHGVIVPLMQNPGSAAFAVSFLKNPLVELWARAAYFRGDEWEVSTTPQPIKWPTAESSLD